MLHKGEIREVGTHSELLALGKIYARLYALQYAGSRELAALRWWVVDGARRAEPRAPE